MMKKRIIIIKIYEEREKERWLDKEKEIESIAWRKKGRIEKRF